MDEELLHLPFPEAIEALRRKIPLPSTSWKQYSGEMQEYAFTISGITQASLLSDIQALVIRHLEQGVSVDDFKSSFADLLDKSGWNLQGDRGYRAELVIGQNTRTAYSRGRYEQLQQVRDQRPYWQWIWADSRMPREHHKAQHLKVYPANSEIFKAIQPPPFGCKCKIFALSERDLEREGLKVSKPPPLDSIAEPGFGHGFDSLPKEKERLLVEALKRLPREFGNLLREKDFAEVIEAALAGTIDFANPPLFGKGSRAKGKKPNCTAGKSHFCQTPNGRGSCVPLSKKCKYKPEGVAKEAADWEGEKVQASTRFQPTIVGGSRITPEALNAALDQLPDESREAIKSFIERNNIGLALVTEQGFTSEQLQQLSPNLSGKVARNIYSNIDGPWTFGMTHYQTNNIQINEQGSAFQKKGGFTDPFANKVEQNNFADLDIKGLQDGIAHDLEQASSGKLVYAVGFDTVGDRASREFAVYLHELGHQVQFATIDAFSGKGEKLRYAGKPVSEYADTNHFERFAEGFAAWALNPSAFKAFDAQGAAIFEKALKHKRKLPKIGIMSPKEKAAADAAAESDD